MASPAGGRASSPRKPGVGFLSSSLILRSSLHADRDQRRHTLVICLLLAVLTVVTYWPVRLNEFVNYDDPGYVTENSHVKRGLSWPAVVWAFRTGHAANWHPLTWLSHMLDCQLYGLGPGGHHLTNLLFHTANTLLLFLLFQRLTGSRWPSAFLAGLFAVHPLHVESVAWVAERKDVLSAFFGLLTLWAYACYVETSALSKQRVVVGGLKKTDRRPPPTPRGPRLWQRASFLYALSVSSFALSLMSKPMLVTLPFLLLLMDYWPLRRLSLHAFRGLRAAGLVVLWEKLPFLALSAASSVVTFFVQKQAGAVSPTEVLPIGIRISNAVLAYVAYLGKLLWPTDLSVFYPYARVWSPGLLLGAAVCLAALTIAALVRRRQSPYLLVGWFWFLGTLVPVIGLVQVGSQAMADRYSYIPSIGVFLALTWLATAVASRRRLGRSVLVVTGALALALCAVLTRKQLSHWQNGETLFRHALAVTTGNFVAHGNLGNALAVKGHPKEAEAEFTAALRIYPDYHPAIYALASILRTNGNLGKALALYEKALQLRPKDAAAYYNHALALKDQERIAEAIQQCRAALRLDPELPQAHNNLAGLLISQGQVEEGLVHAQTALRLDPASAPAHLNAGNALFLQEKFQEAERHYRMALKLDPSLPDAQLDLAKALVNQDRLEEAEVHLREAARLQPNEAEAHQILAAIYATQKRAQAAVTEYTIALQLNPDWAEGMNSLAGILAAHPDASIRDGLKAVQLATKACALTGGTNMELQQTLAAAYAAAGMFPQAVNLQEAVLDWALRGNVSDAAASARQRLELYRAGQPYREP
jgi:protein O-mannosyl-transferase